MRLARVLAVLAGLAVLCILSLELSLRAYYRAPLAPRVFGPSPLKIGYGLKPSVSVDYAKEGRVVRVSIDSAGHRMVVPLPEGRPGTTVHVLGDSQVFGWGLADEETVPSRLQRKLGPGWTVVNHGVPGYGPFAYADLIACLHEGDVAVIVLTEVNDFQDAYVAKAPAMARCGYLVSRTPLGEGLPCFMLDSYSLSKIAELMVLLNDSRLPVPLGYNPNTETASRVLNYRIEKLLRQKHETKRNVVIRAVVPWDAAIVPGRLANYQPLLAAPKRLVDLADDCATHEAFRSRPDPNRLFLTDSHLSAAGADLMSELLARQIRQRLEGRKTIDVAP